MYDIYRVESVVVVSACQALLASIESMREEAMHENCFVKVPKMATISLHALLC